MSAVHNTKKLTAGSAEVEDIYEIAEMLGLDVIKINGKKSSASVGSVSGFEVGDIGYNHLGRVDGAVTKVGHVYLYPDVNSIRWGFVLDTPKNRRVLASHIAAPVIDIVDKRIKDELIKYCDDNGINVKPEAPTNPYVKKSIPEQRLENQNEKLEADVRMLKRQLEDAIRQKEENDIALLRKEQYRDSQSEVTVKEIHVDPITEEGYEVEVEATTPALNKEPVKGVRTSKADKPLAGKKAVKK